MVINARSYADFKAVAASLRKVDAVFYNNSASISGVITGVAYAFDFQAGIAITAQAPGLSLSTTDFPSAIAIGDHMQVSDVSALASSF